MVTNEKPSSITIPDDLDALRSRIASRSLSPYQLKDADDITVWMQSSVHNGKRPGDDAVEELLTRHDPYIRHLAYGIYNRKKSSMEFEDAYQNAKVAAQLAYTRFKPQVAQRFRARLTTFMQSTVKHELITNSDQESFVRCTAQMRPFRRYFAGGMDEDPVAKAEFERKHGLDTPEKIETLRNKLRALLPQYLPFDGPTEVAGDDEGFSFSETTADTQSLSEDALCMQIDRDNILNSLTPRAREVYRLHTLNGETMNATADMVGCTLGQVISDLRIIERAFKKYRETLRAEGVA